MGGWLKNAAAVLGSLTPRLWAGAVVLLGLGLLGALGPGWADGALEGPGVEDREGVELFEKSVRPVLVERCSKCHGAGAKAPKGGLTLDTPDGLLRGGDSGPAIAPGDPDGSLLIRAIRYNDAELKMPPKRRLAPDEVAALTAWVKQGAPTPRTMAAAGPAGAGPSQAGDHWAFRPVQNPPVPANPAGNPIDAFILAGLEPRGLRPAPPADKATLLRRATFDLTGLPPTPGEVDDFLEDRSPDAFARVVDRLLASPAYGVRWGRHWLDLVRYTDYHYPDPRAHGRAALFELFESWRYRDWVVEAFNRDMPYDEFVVHQIAGDLLPSPKGEPVYPDGLIATGLLAIGVWDNGDADKNKIVSDIVADQIDVVGKAFLGLTIACARCHDHKFDPISQRDYYGLAGIFHSTRILAGVGGVGDHTVALRVPLVPPSYLARRDQQQKQIQGLAHLVSVLKGLEFLAVRAKLLAVPLRALGHARPGQPAPGPGAQGSQGVRPGLALGRGLAWALQLRDALQAALLPEPPVALAAQEGGTPGGMFPGVQDVPLHIRGSYTRLGPVVPRHLPAVLVGETQEPIRGGSGRLELARRIARADNPLTARVLVNRVWQHHFGEGIVRTPNNFGKLGEPPSHPELLNWLAGRFVQDGWSVKRLHRRILLSATYQQTSVADPEQLRRDPENRWLGRMSPRRLEAEAIRDGMLLVAGRLDRARGGPAVADLELPRRSLYVQTVRQDRSNYSTLFDAANPEEAAERRTTSTVAPQALFLLNSRFVRAQAEGLARRLGEPGPRDEAARIDLAYRWLYGRPARAEEIITGRAFLDRARTRGAEAAWTDYAHVLLCSNEFVYLD